MRANPDDPSRRYFEAARWYLPPMGGEPEPDPTLACTYALLALYAKLDALIEAMPADADPSRADSATTLDALDRMLWTLGRGPARKLRKGLDYN